jgi:hypothetical protein
MGYCVMNDSFSHDLLVRVHLSVFDRGWAGFARHHEAGHWEFHCTADTLEAPLELVPLHKLLDADPSLRELESLPPMSQAWRWERGDEFQTSRLPTGPTYFFQIEASPTPDHPEYETVGGAFVICWIRIESEIEAQQIVKRVLTNCLWMIESMQGPEIRTAEDYGEDEEGGQDYRQAQLDGEVFVFHVYPREDA